MSKVVDETITVSDLLAHVRDLKNKEEEYIRAIEQLRGGDLKGACNDTRPSIKTLYAVLKHIQFELEQISETSLEEIPYALLAVLKEQKEK